MNNVVINPDKSAVKKATKQISKNGGYCPFLLDLDITYNCKSNHKCCKEFEDSKETICPLGMFIKLE